jgi:hypothetical protein
MCQQAWWRGIHDIFMKKRSGGHRAWVLGTTSIATVLSLLVISPLSSSLFVSQQVLYQRAAMFQRYTHQQNRSIELLPRRDTTPIQKVALCTARRPQYVTQSHIALPFGPVAGGAKATSSPKEAREAETQIIRTSYSCKPIRNQAQEIVNLTYTMQNTNILPNDVTKNLTGQAEFPTTPACFRRRVPYHDRRASFWTG